MTPSLPMKAPECITRPPAAMTRQLPRGGGAYARKPPPVAPLDAAKTKLPFDPLPPPPPPPKAKEPPPPPARIRMAKEREGKIPLAERLEPGDVDFGKVSFVDFDGDCGGECVCGVVCGDNATYGGGDSGACPSTNGKRGSLCFPVLLLNSSFLSSHQLPVEHPLFLSLIRQVKTPDKIPHEPASTCPYLRHGMRLQSARSTWHSSITRIECE